MDYANPNATFDHNDIFERKRYAIQAMKWIDAYPVKEQGYSLVIDAPWGVGKTTFLNMWKFDIKRAHPEYKKEHPDTKPIFSVAKREVVYYNAWENDRSEDPFAPLLWTIISTLTMDKYPDPKIQVSGDAIYDAINALAVAIATMNPSNLALQSVPTIMKSVKHLSEIFSRGQDTPVSKIVAAMNEQHTTRAALRKALTDLARACGTLFIMVDELDRCRPSFAIETLEAIYQYFGLPNIVFIFSVDMTQLSHVIGGRYGVGFDAGGYANKFFTRTLRLPTPSAQQMIIFADQNTNLHLACKDELECQEEFELVFQACGITPREIPMLYHELSSYFTPQPMGYYHDKLRSDLALFILAVLCMKYRMPESYKAFLRGEADIGVQRLSAIPHLSHVITSFLPYMRKTYAECYEEWHPHWAAYRNASQDEDLMSESLFPSVAYAILSKLKQTDKANFGQMLFYYFT